MKDPGSNSPIGDLREELGQEFLRVAAREPRSRILRRLRYAGIALVCTLLVVPAAVAISGEESTSPPRAGLPVGETCAAVPVPPPLLAPGEHRRPRHRAALADLCATAAPFTALDRLPPGLRQVEARATMPCVRIVKAERRGHEPLRTRHCLRTFDRALSARPPRIDLLAPTIRPGLPPLRRELRPTRRLKTLRSDCLTIVARGDRQLEARAC